MLVWPIGTPKRPVVPLAHYLWILRRHKWRIVAFVLVCVTSTVVVSSRLTPIYEATASIDIDRQAPPAVIGQDAARMAPNDADQFLATQIKAIQSRLRATACGAALQDCRILPAAPAASLQRACRTPPSCSRTSRSRARPILTCYSSATVRPVPSARPPDVANGIADSYIQHTYNLRFQASSGLAAFMEKQMDDPQSHHGALIGRPGLNSKRT